MEDLISLSETISQASTLLADGIPGEESASSRSSSSVVQVVAIGTIGSGKSSVLNSIIGHPVMPFGEGGVTKFTTVIDVERNIHVGDGVRGKFGSDTNLQNAADIRKALQSDMRERSRSKQDKILVLMSKTAPPIRLIDIPGIESRASESDNAVFDNSGGNTIILVVISAHEISDKSSARIFKLAEKIDQDGSRTLFVLTHLDQLDPSTADEETKKTLFNAVELLSGKTNPNSPPWLAMIGQPGDSPAKDSLEDNWKAETAVLSKILRSCGGRGLDARLGRESVVREIAKTARKKMKDRIPKIISGLEARAQSVGQELVQLGDSVPGLSEKGGARAAALQLCRGFDANFIDSLDGGEGGGAKMVDRFVGALPGRFRSLPLEELFSMENVKKVTTEADGYQPYLTSPEKGLRQLIKRCLDLAKEPGVQCVDEVHRILVDVVTACSNSAPSLVRFPNLKREIVALAGSSLDQYRAESRLVVSSLVDMERVFIPPGHFIDAAAKRYEAIRMEQEASRKRELEKIKRTTGEPTAAETSKGRSIFRRSQQAAAPEPAQPAQPAPPAASEELECYLWKVNSKGGWSKRWFALSEKTKRLYYVHNETERQPRGVIELEESLIEDNVSPKEVPAIPGDPTKASSLSIKITNKVPYKSVVKAHYSLIVRTETLEQKELWVRRLRAIANGGQKGAAGDQKKDPASVPDDREDQPPENPPEQPPADAADGVNSAPPDAGPFKMERMSPEEELKHMAMEVREYVGAVLGQLSANIPKAIVLTQVEKVKDSMLTKLYTSISKLSDEQIALLLAEDPESKGRREKAQKQHSFLSTLKRQLALQEAKASAEEANAAPPVKESVAKEEWRIAFQQAGNKAEFSEELPSRSRASRKDPQDKKKPPPPAPPAQPQGPPPPAANDSSARQRSPLRGGPRVEAQPAPPPQPPAQPPAQPPVAPGPPIGAGRRRAPPPPPSGAGGLFKF